MTTFPNRMIHQSTWRAVGVCLIGWLIQALLIAVLFSITGVPAPETASG